jgi:hypothetical protein
MIYMRLVILIALMLAGGIRAWGTNRGEFINMMRRTRINQLLPNMSAAHSSILMWRGKWSINEA